MTLQSSTDGNIQKCTSVYIFELRVFHWKNSSLLNTPDILSAITSLTFRQTRVQALYMDVQRLIEDFRFNRCPESFPIPVYSSHTAVTRSVKRECCSLFVNWSITPFITLLIYSFLYQMLELLSIIILIFSLYLLYQKLYSLFHPSY